MVMAPAGRDGDELVAYFRKVAEAPIPIMLQNAPPPFGAGLKPDIASYIVQRVPQIRFAKEETMPCGQNLSRLMAACGDRLEAREVELVGAAGTAILVRGDIKAGEKVMTTRLSKADSGPGGCSVGGTARTVRAPHRRPKHIRRNREQTDGYS